MFTFSNIPEAFKEALAAQMTTRFGITGSLLNACFCPFLEHGDCATTRLLLTRRYSPMAADITLVLMAGAEKVLGL